MTMTMIMTHSGNQSNYGFLFKEWDIYKDARQLRKEINLLTKKFPPDEKYALIDQTRRALNSIVLNIAEGANRKTDKDVRAYMNRAHGSLDEVVACLDCAEDSGYISGADHGAILEKASSLGKRLRKFGAYLDKSS